jgi:glycosyltransferase involved in cell wall biosynthesis
MANSPLVTTIIPTYNRANLIAEAVDSVLAQTYPTVEVIVVDDGSTDATSEVLARYGDRIRVISQRNAGPAAARNRGIAAANGEFIAFLDSDDLWLPEKLDRQLNLLQRLGNGIPCCLSNIRLSYQNRELTSFEIAWLNPVMHEGVWRNPDEVLATRFVLFNQGVVVRRAVLQEIGGFDERFWLLEDYDLALRLSVRGDWAFVRDPLVIWRESATSSLSRDAVQDDRRWKQPLVDILEKQLHWANGEARDDRREKWLRGELKRARRQLSVARIGQMSFAGASIVSKGLERLEQYRSALHRRLPWFPRMQAEEFHVAN